MSLEKASDDCLTAFGSRLKGKQAEIFREFGVTEEEMDRSMAYFAEHDEEVKDLQEAIIEHRPKVEFSPEEIQEYRNEYHRIFLDMIFTMSDALQQDGLEPGTQALSVAMQQRLQGMRDAAKSSALKERGPAWEASHIFVYLANAEQYPESWNEARKRELEIAHALRDAGCPHAADEQELGIQRADQQQQMRKQQMMQQMMMGMGGGGGGGGGDGQQMDPQALAAMLQAQQG